MLYTGEEYMSEKWLYNNNQKIVVLGGTGGIGTEVTHLLSNNHDVLSLGSKDLDVTNIETTNKVMHLADPEVLISFVGYNYNSMLHKVVWDNCYNQVDVNIMGTINVLSATLKIMRERNFGRIILTSSVLTKKTVMGTSVYSACKSFIETMARVAAVENASKDITINCLRLGYMDAGLTYEIPADIRSELSMSIPSKKFGSMENIVSVIEMLIESDYVNGTSIDVNGGLNGM